MSRPVRPRARTSKPELAVSIGDPAGIGPEIVVRCAARSDVKRACSLVLYGDQSIVAAAARAARLDLGDTAVTDVIQAGRRRRSGSGLPKPGKASGAAAFAALDAAARAVAAGEHDGLVTAPINKYWMAEAGYDYDGHTGYLSELAGEKATMMLAGRKLRVVLATTHLAHRDVPKRLKARDIVHAALAADRHLKALHGIERPRLAVAALNPHAGENGLFGNEEARVIEPAIAKITASGVSAEGPFPADTLFATARDGDYDAVVCMYHDQALIPLKLLEFGRSVNISMGLPFIRTSPDHGTAYELAGTGKARPESMAEAVLQAARMAKRRRRSA